MPYPAVAESEKRKFIFEHDEVQNYDRSIYFTILKTDSDLVMLQFRSIIWYFVICSVFLICGAALRLEPGFISSCEPEPVDPPPEPQTLQRGTENLNPTIGLKVSSRLIIKTLS